MFKRKFTFLGVVILTIVPFIKCYPGNIGKVQELYNNYGENSKEIFILDYFSWNCANNATCIDLISKDIINSYRKGDTLNLGLFSFGKVNSVSSNSIDKTNKPNDSGTGRGASNLENFFKNNIFTLPFGPSLFKIKRADDERYLEVTLLKNDINVEGRRHKKRGPGLQGKKQFQIFIPIYLAATTLGWTLVAVKAVGILTLKAFIISKLAFLAAAAAVIKKLMDTASEKMMFQQHQPYVIPYNMEYGYSSGHGMPGHEFGANEFYNIHYANPHSALENMAAAENQHGSDSQPNSSHLQLLNAVTNGVVQQKVKRNDQITGVTSTKPLFYNLAQQQNQPAYMYKK